MPFLSCCPLDVVCWTGLLKTSHIFKSKRELQGRTAAWPARPLTDADSFTFLHALAGTAR